MLHHIKKLFGIKTKEQVQPESPYKVEAPVTPVADDITRAMLESIPTSAKKKSAAKKTPAAKKPRKPKTAK